MPGFLATTSIMGTKFTAPIVVPFSPAPTSAPGGGDFSDAESQRVLTAAVDAVTYEIGRAVAREPWAEWAAGVAAAVERPVPAAAQRRSSVRRSSRRSRTT